MKSEYTKFAPGFQGKDAMREKAKKMFGGSKMVASELKVRSSRSAPDKIKPRLYAKGGVVAERTTTMASHLKKGRCYNDGGDVEGEYIAAKRGGKIKKPHKMQHVEIDRQVARPHVPKRSKPLKNPLEGPHPKGARVVISKHSRKKKYESGGIVMDDPVDAARMGMRAPMAAPSRAQQALGLARQYAPQAQDFLNRNAPRLGKAFGRVSDFASRIAPHAQEAYGMAKRYAPQAQDFISRFSPSLGQKFGRFRSMVGLKKGGRVEHYAMGGVGKIRHGQSTKSGRPIIRKSRKDR